MKAYHHHPLRVFWDEGSSAFICIAPDLPGCSAVGDSPEEAVREMGTAMRRGGIFAKPDVAPRPRSRRRIETVTATLMTTHSETEQKILKRSIAITVGVASSGIFFGLLSGSLSIVFDGLFSVIDVAILMLALAVARLVQHEGDRRFQHGYWHIEPMALVFNGTVLMFLCLYAFINAVDSFLAGGRELQLDWAIG